MSAGDRLALNCLVSWGLDAEGRLVVDFRLGLDVLERHRGQKLVGKLEFCGWGIVDVNNAQEEDCDSINDRTQSIERPGEVK